MSLMDTLRQVGATLPPSEIPSDGEIAGVVGALAIAEQIGWQQLTDIKDDPDALLDLLHQQSANEQTPPPQNGGKSDTGSRKSSKLPATD